MNYTFTTEKIICHKPLGSYDGIRADGLRFHYIIAVNNIVTKIVSGDGINDSNLQYDTNDPNTDSIYVREGTIIDLPRHTPREGGSGFVSNLYNIQPNDKIEIVLIGINEGVAYMGGGGGIWNNEFKFLVEKIMSAFGKEGEAIGKGFGMFVDFISKHYNDFDKCKGNIFAFKSEFSGIQLMEATLLQKSKMFILNSMQNQLPLYFINESKPPKCNIPNYDVYLKIGLLDTLSLMDTTNKIHERSSEYETYTPPKPFFAFPCKKENLQIRYKYYSNEININTNFKFLDLPFVWEINDQEVNQSGNIQIATTCYHPKNGNYNDVVPLSVNLLSSAYNEQVKITTNYQRGDFSLDMKLKIKFPNITHIFYHKAIEVDTIELEGNKEYNEYINCYNENLGTITRFSEKFSIQLSKLKNPLDPIAFKIKNEKIHEFKKIIERLK